MLTPPQSTVSQILWDDVGKEGRNTVGKSFIRPPCCDLEQAMGRYLKCTCVHGRFKPLTARTGTFPTQVNTSGQFLSSISPHTEGFQATLSAFCRSGLLKFSALTGPIRTGTNITAVFTSPLRTVCKFPFISCRPCHRVSTWVHQYTCCLIF